MNPPEPDKKIIPTTKSLKHDFDIQDYIAKNRDSLYSRLIFEYLSELDLKDSKSCDRLNSFLVSNPINLDVLILLLGNFVHLDEVTSQKKASKRNTTNAKKPRVKKPSQDDLNEFKKNYEIEFGQEYGWIKAATYFFDISRPTISRIMNGE